MKNIFTVLFFLVIFVAGCSSEHPLVSMPGANLESVEMAPGGSSATDEDLEAKPQGSCLLKGGYWNSVGVQCIEFRNMDAFDAQIEEDVCKMWGSTWTPNGTCEITPDLIGTCDKTRSDGVLLKEFWKESPRAGLDEADTCRINDDGVWSDL